MEKIKYWWSEDRQWFCILANDGTRQTTVSLTIEEAERLMDEVMQTPSFLALQEEAGRRALVLLDAARDRELGTGNNPRVTDNDEGEIVVSLNGKELRGWSYVDDAERRKKMLAAREYVEGWCDGRDAECKHLKDKIDARLNDNLCEMKEGYDDSIVGFNEAWDITRKIFAEAAG
jgi:hypothetical protein